MTRTSVWGSGAPLVIAHRGGLEFAPENTIDAFRSAVDMGIPFLETDVHVTADGVLVSFHDEELDRVTDSTGRIDQLPYEEVARARLDGGRLIPTFEQLVEEFPGVRLNIDVKSDAAVVPFVAAVRRYGIIDRIGVGAFSDRRLRRVRGLLGPRLSTVASPRETSSLLTASQLRRSTPYSQTNGGSQASTRSGRLQFDAVQVPVKHGPVTILTRRFVNYVHSQGRVVHAWTINERGEMERLLDMGVDGIITDRPQLLRQVIAERETPGTLP